MTHTEIKELVKQIWQDGVRDFDEIDRNWDPSDIQEGIDETFQEYWEHKGNSIINKIQGESDTQDNTHHL